ncbi:hypothetical protein O3797_06030 [Gemella sanguinis]|uniref:hypothetical protein n=1 Tax=Gemella sanguinis TaxID=84135 RepID=UPI0008076289|nr:hypothetical protein [Gemella sanguinis]
MKDMLSIIIRTILAIVAIFVIIIVFAVGTNSSEDKRKIRQDQERIVEYTKEKVEFLNHEDIKKIEFKKYERNLSTGIWNFEVILNDREDVIFKAVGLEGEIYLGSFDGENIRLVQNKTKKNYNDIEVIYAK